MFYRKEKRIDTAILWNRAFNSADTLQAARESGGGGGGGWEWREIWCGGASGILAASVHSVRLSKLGLFSL